MSNILLVVDRPNWAYSTKADALVNNYKGSEFIFKVVSVKHPDDVISSCVKWADLLVLFGFQNFRRLHKLFGVPAKKCLVSIASHASWDQGKTCPDHHPLPNKELISSLKMFKGVGAVSYRLQLLFRFAGLHNTSYTPNGVPLEMFPSNFEWAGNDSRLVFGYAGRDKDTKKGNRSIIRPAFRQVQEVNFVQALCDFKLEKKTGIRGTSYLEYEKMPNFYQGMDCYVCMSREEGSCRSVLEAMASGCAIISTDCGAVNEFIIHKYNGLIVDRDTSSLISAIRYLNKHRALLTRMKDRKSVV